MIKALLQQKERKLVYIRFYRDSHPLLVPVLQKKKGSKASKTANKERLDGMGWDGMGFTVGMG